MSSSSSSSSPKLKLYRKDGACSLIPHILLQHLGLPFTAIKLGPDANGKLAAADGSLTHDDYLKINPLGYVPALDVGGGVIITELPAVLTYIVGLASSVEAAADESGGAQGVKNAAGLLGDTLVQKTQVVQWIAYFSGTVHALGFKAIYRPERFVGGNTSAYGDVKEGGRKVVDAGLAIIEERLSSPGRRYIVGDKLTTADFVTYLFYQWGGRIGIDMGSYPSYTRLVRELEGLEGVRKAIKDEGAKLAVLDS